MSSDGSEILATAVRTARRSTAPGTGHPWRPAGTRSTAGCCRRSYGPPPRPARWWRRCHRAGRSRRSPWSPRCHRCPWPRRCRRGGSRTPGRPTGTGSSSRSPRARVSRSASAHPRRGSGAHCRPLVEGRHEGAFRLQGDHRWSGEPGGVHAGIEGEGARGSLAQLVHVLPLPVGLTDRRVGDHGVGGRQRAGQRRLDAGVAVRGTARYRCRRGRDGEPVQGAGHCRHLRVAPLAARCGARAGWDGCTARPQHVRTPMREQEKVRVGSRGRRPPTARTDGRTPGWAG